MIIAPVIVVDDAKHPVIVKATLTNIPELRVLASLMLHPRNSFFVVIVTINEAGVGSRSGGEGETRLLQNSKFEMAMLLFVASLVCRTSAQVG